MYLCTLWKTENHNGRKKWINQWDKFHDLYLNLPGKA